METANKKQNYCECFLGVVLIALVWIAVVAIGVILVALFNGGFFFIRTACLMPFSFGGVYATRSILKHYF